MPQPSVTGRNKTRSITSRPLLIQYSPLATLKSDPHNARVHSEKQVRQIAPSIETFGFNVPILFDRNLNVIAGHGRVLAAKIPEIGRVPNSRLEHLTEHQPRAFMIADKD